MGKVETITCDKCGCEISSFCATRTSAKIHLWGVGVNRSGAEQRIDLCEDCFSKFVAFMEGAIE